jgi:hypothetical protein
MEDNNPILNLLRNRSISLVLSSILKDLNKKDIHNLSKAIGADEDKLLELSFIGKKLDPKPFPVNQLSFSDLYNNYTTENFQITDEDFELILNGVEDFDVFPKKFFEFLSYAYLQDYLVLMNNIIHKKGYDYFIQHIFYPKHLWNNIYNNRVDDLHYNLGQVRKVLGLSALQKMIYSSKQLKEIYNDILASIDEQMNTSNYLYMFRRKDLKGLNKYLNSILDLKELVVDVTGDHVLDKPTEMIYDQVMEEIIDHQNTLINLIQDLEVQQ